MSFVKANFTALIKHDYNYQVNQIKPLCGTTIF